MALHIDRSGKNIKTKDIADAVCKVLGQTAELKAELVFVSAERIRELNRETRGIDKVTDVLSYPSLDGIRGKVLKKKDYPTETDGRNLFIGSIVICEDKVKEQAEEFGHSEEKERTYLIIHGLMHLFGYDHMEENDKKQMREKEKAALALLGIEE